MNTSGQLRSGLPKRLAVLAIISIVAMIGVFDSLARAIADVSPASAHFLAPWDGVITANYAFDTFESTLDRGTGSVASLAAAKALRQDATAVQALTVLGLQAQLRFEPDRTRALFAYSLVLSRRELQPRLWAIEEAVSRGDISAALANYDIALRTSKSAEEMLFPILSSSMSERTIFPALVRLTRGNPVWAKRFVEYVVRNTDEPTTARQFVAAISGSEVPVDAVDRAALVNRMIALQQQHDAWMYFSSFRRGLLADRSRDPLFSGNASAPTLFDWTPVEGDGLSVSFQQDKNGHYVDFYAAPGADGSMLRQIEVLPRGRYRFVGKSSAEQHSSESEGPYWVLRCSDGREGGRIRLPASERLLGFTASFEVPRGCPTQTLDFVVPFNSFGKAVAGRLYHAELIRVSD